MFCSQCGTEAGPKGRYCKKCGSALTRGSAPPDEDNRTAGSQPDGITTGMAATEAKPSEFNLASSGSGFPGAAPPMETLVRTRRRRSWRLPVIAAVAVLLIAGGAFMWGTRDNGAGSGSEQSAQATPEASDGGKPPTAPAMAAAPAASPKQSPSPVVFPADPAYIKVNQVDSARYENGGVDVYFSLFADPEFKQEIQPMQLAKDMVTINGLPVEKLSLVEESDTVSVNLVLDKSGSMQDPPNMNVSESKMDLVRQAAVQFIDGIPSSAKGRFEVLTFSDYVPAVADITFTSDRTGVSQYLSGLASDGGRTALFDSLTKALYDTNEQQGPKYIIAFTDGKDSNYGSSLQSVVDLSRQLGIPIYTVGFGSEDDQSLKYIAQETGGQSFYLSTDDDLETELHRIYDTVFQRYVKQYKLTYTPRQKIAPGQPFSFAMNLNSPRNQAQTRELTYERKLDKNSVDVQNGLFEYQVNYAQAVNTLDFGVVGDNVDEDSEFYTNLRNRIEIDYVKASNQGKPKIIDPLENYRVESIDQLQNGSYKIKFFKLFPVLMNNKQVHEADLNTYTLVWDSLSDKWQVSNFGREECSIY
ncbi:VWA domain-containing protein [Paenibacillus rhizophilus]|uniref:VWA domain-containing protein n=1 Tax=Paenibacillus rhizophilus TaxID=1850366 RepID=A0A3N9P371_9BACL|nr:VWA domain-containing protein [Paenibacillus rhizophilus]RQW10661.1 VWA domain-containing protein [Paenibacillus rhizophilus]